MRSSTRLQFTGIINQLFTGRCSEQKESLYVAVDCEMSQSLTDSVPIKITVVDEKGLLLLDTLVNPLAVITASCEKIHGISPEWLHDAPTLREVKEHLKQICSGANFVGHSVRHDLGCLGLRVPYIDTCFFEDEQLFEKGIKPSQNPALKKLAAHYLNAEIQDGQHSSVSQLV
jgi:DNA polymerase III epsilon subunit-like protein